MSFIGKPGGTGDISGPESAADGSIPIFVGTDGKVLQGTPVLIAPVTGDVSKLGNLSLLENTELKWTDTGLPGGTQTASVKNVGSANLEIRAKSQLAVTIRETDVIVQHTQDAVSLAIAGFKTQGGASFAKSVRIGGDAYLTAGKLDVSLGSNLGINDNAIKISMASPQVNAVPLILVELGAVSNVGVSGTKVTIGGNNNPLVSAHTVEHGWGCEATAFSLLSQSAGGDRGFSYYANNPVSHVIKGTAFRSLQNDNESFESQYCNVYLGAFDSGNNRVLDGGTIVISRRNVSSTLNDNFDGLKLKREGIATGGSLNSAGSTLHLENSRIGGGGGADTVSLLKLTQSVLIATKFKRYKDLDGLIIYKSIDGTTPQGNLTGVQGDICYNGPGGKDFYCTGGVNWT